MNRPPTIRDVAAAAGVSAATVSRVLTGNRVVSPAVEKRVRQAMKDLDYVVNAQARALTGTGAGTVAILLPQMTSPFHNQVAEGVADEAATEGRLCLVCPTMGDPGVEMALAETMRERNTEAVVLIGGVQDIPEYRDRMTRLALALDAAGSRLVLCGRPTPGEQLPVTVVEYDNEGGAFAAVSHLLSHGHERILLLNGPDGNTTSDGRRTGYERALRTYGIEPDPELMIAGDSTRDHVRQRMADLLAAGAPAFTAVFCWDDAVASGAMAAIRAAGMSIPGDISVIGYNDAPTALDVTPALTSVHIPALELGRNAIRLALHRADPLKAGAAQHITLGTHIVIRDSVRALVRRPGRA